jgi:hypothetical protein
MERMRKRIAAFTGNRKGSAIVAVIIVFVMFTILAAALMLLSVSSNAGAAAQVKTQQSYLTARGAADAMKSAINTDQNFKNMLAGMSDGQTYTGTGTYNGQQYQVTVTKNSGTQVDIKACAVSPSGALQQPVYVHMTAPTSSTTTTTTQTVMVDCSNAFNNLFYYKGSMTHYMESGGAIGNLSYNGTVYIAQDSQSGGSPNNVRGSVFNNGTIYLSGQQAGITELDCISDVHLQDYFYNPSGWGGYQSDNNFVLGASSNPIPVNIEGSLYMTGHNGYSWTDTQTGVLYASKVFVNHDISMRSYCTIYGNVVCGGNLSIDSTCNIIGNVTARSVSGSGANMLKESGKLTITSNIPVLKINYTPPDKLPDITVPTVTAAAAPDRNGVITQDGILTKQSFSSFNTLTVNTSGGDVNLIVNSALSLSGKNILVTGGNNLYIYLVGGSSNLTLKNGSNIGMKTASGGVDSSTAASHWPHVFIIGTGQTITQNDTSLLRANIYLPSGIFAGSWSGSGNRFMGTAVVSDDKITVSDSSETLYFMQPTLSLPQLVTIATGGYSVGNFQGYWSGS